MRFLPSFAISSLSILVLSLGAVGCGDDDSNGGEGGSPGATGAGASGSGAGAEGAGAGPSSSSGTGNVGNAFPGEYNCDAPSGSVPALQLVEVASGLSQPVQLKAAPGD